MSVVVVVQARMGSTRLPGKVLEPVAGRPLLQLMLERLAPLRDGFGDVVVATSDLPADDPVAEVVRRCDLPVVRGPEADVLGRFLAVLERHPADDVVRLTADCPLHDPDVVAGVLAHHRAAQADYTSNTLVRTFPDGLDVEVVRAEALHRAATEAVDAAEREHVTPFVYRRPSTFLVAQHAVADDAGDERWTIDTADDLAWLRDVTASGPLPTGWGEVLRRLGRRAPRDGLRLRPVPLPDVAQRGPWLRRWSLDDAGRAVGAVEVVVDDAVGRARFDVDLDRRPLAEQLLAAALRSDAQVHELAEVDDG